MNSTEEEPHARPKCRPQPSVVGVVRCPPIETRHASAFLRQNLDRLLSIRLRENDYKWHGEAARGGGASPLICGASVKLLRDISPRPDDKATITKHERLGSSGDAS